MMRDDSQDFARAIGALEPMINSMGDDLVSTLMATMQNHTPAMEAAPGYQEGDGGRAILLASCWPILQCYMLMGLSDGDPDEIGRQIGAAVAVLLRESPHWVKVKPS